ncbi:conserved hypothetical protein [delta proteobacterium NaphS2]|nr:conserved hypothetical protein [delta proteobacterium NaphS2]
MQLFDLDLLVILFYYELKFFVGFFQHYLVRVVGVSVKFDGVRFLELVKFLLSVFQHKMDYKF